ncbi:MAG: cobalamin B12-binding domain-containing protein [Thermoplasmatota archaeon]
MIDEKIYRKYLDNLKEGNKKKCIEIVNSLIDEDIDVKELYIGLIQPSMYKVGELWEKDEISVADEHLATSITDRILTMIYPRIFSGEKKGKTAIVACVANEYHQLGGRMVADFFELHGWDGYFIGADTPIEDLLDLIDEKKPEVVGLSLAMYFNLPELKEAIEVIHGNYPDLDIIVGGQAFRHGGSDFLENYQNVKYIPSLNELEEIIS